MDDKKVSKLISYWLRHAPESAGLTLDRQGWTSTAELIKALSDRRLMANVAELQALATRTDKIRWEFSKDGSRVRATHGHSVEVALDEAKRATPPAILYHGTPERAVGSILQEGLRPMSRKAVHLAAAPAEALTVGRRRGKAVLLKIDSEAMHKAEQAFYQTSKGVWLTEMVLPQYITLLP
jgi:putative RNA 2'-phosphotransferase